MLEELLRHDSLGNRQELLCFLYDGLYSSEQIPIKALRQYCIDKNFSIARTFDGIIELFRFVAFIDIGDGFVSIRPEFLNASKTDREAYFDDFHFYSYLFRALEETVAYSQIFSEESVKYDAANGQYYLLEKGISLKYFSIRNLLLTTGFLRRKIESQPYLYIDKKFTDQFRLTIIAKLTKEHQYKRKMTISSLKAALARNEALGLEAELYVLSLEQVRLKEHPFSEKIVHIATETVNAGYDIESFLNIESIFTDKFIEVKSYSDKIAFFWSKNEVEAAKAFGEKYFLYLVDRNQIGNINYKPKSISDPFRKVFQSEFWKKKLRIGKSR